jgi:thiosulfate dehydrogenase
MAAPSVWGPASYNVGAGMARVSVAAAFIKANMPRGWGWSLTDDEAFDVAAYINSQPRPDFPGKAHDWPNGGKPADVPY